MKGYFSAMTDGAASGKHSNLNDQSIFLLLTYYSQQIKMKISNTANC